jgi:hypothetical protein
MKRAAIGGAVLMVACAATPDRRAVPVPAPATSVAETPRADAGASPVLRCPSDVQVTPEPGVSTWLERDDRRVCCAYRGKAAAPAGWRESSGCMSESAPGLRGAPAGPTLAYGSERVFATVTFEPGGVALSREARDRLDELAERFKSVEQKQSLGALEIRVSSGSDREGPPKGAARARAENIAKHLATKGITKVETYAVPGKQMSDSSAWVGAEWSHVSPGKKPCEPGVTLRAMVPRVGEPLHVTLCRNGECSAGTVDPGAGSSDKAGILFGLDGALEATGLLTLQGRLGLGPAGDRAAESPEASGEQMVIEVRCAFRRRDLDAKDRYTWTVAAGRDLVRFEGPVSFAVPPAGPACSDALLRVN